MKESNCRVKLRKIIHQSVQTTIKLENIEKTTAKAKEKLWKSNSPNGFSTISKSNRLDKATSVSHNTKSDNGVAK